MNVCKVTLFNFCGTEGLVECVLNNDLNQFSSDSAIISGLRFLLDRTFCLEDSELTTSYVELTIKQVGDDAVLRIKRTVEQRGRILVDPVLVPADRYFWELGEIMGCVDASWFERFAAFTGKDWLEYLTHTQINPDGDINGLGFMKDTLPTGLVKLAEWKAFLSRRLEGFERRQERNNMIRTSRALEKSRNKIIHQRLSTTVAVLSQRNQECSSACNELQSRVHQLTEDMVSDQTTLCTCEAICAMVGFYITSNFPDIQELQDVLNCEAEQTLQLLSQVNQNQKDHLDSIQQLQNLPTTSRKFQLEENLCLMQIAHLPVLPVESLESERVSLSHWHTSCQSEFDHEREEVQKDLLGNDSCLGNLTAQVERLKQNLKEDMSRLDHTIRSCNKQVNEANRHEVDKIHLVEELKTIRGVLEGNGLDFESELNGLASLTQLLAQDGYLETRKTEYFGPLFQWVRFKKGVDMVTKNYFRYQLRDWFFAVIVKSAAFASKLMKDFNGQKCRGTVTILPSDNYRQKPDGAAKAGVSLIDVLDITENHPLRNLFSTFIFNEQSDFPGDSTGDVSLAGGSIHGGGLVSGCPYSTVQTEKWLQQFYDIQIELVALEGIKLPLVGVESLVKRELDRIVDNLSEFAALTRNVTTDLMYKQQAAGDRLASLSFAKRELLKVEWSHRINSRLLEVVMSGEFEKDYAVYEARFDELMKRPREQWTPNFATDSIDILEQLRHVVETRFETLYWPVAPAIVTRKCIYLDIEFPYTEIYEDLWEERQNQQRELADRFRLYLKGQRLMVMYQRAAEGVSVDPSNSLSTHAHPRKTLQQLEEHLRQLQWKYNVYPRSVEYNKGTENFAKKLRKGNVTGEHRKQFEVVESSLRHYLEYEESAGKQELLTGRLWPLIEIFYKTVCDSVKGIDIIAKLSAPEQVGNVNLSLAAMRDVELVFRTALGNFRADEMEPNCIQIFAIAVLFAKVTLNNIRLVSLKDVERLDPETLRRIVELFLGYGVQVVLQHSLSTWDD